MELEETKQYKELYNQLVEVVVVYYNEHKEFLTGRRCVDHNTVARVTKNLRKLIKIEKNMLSLIKDIYNIEKKGREAYMLSKQIKRQKAIESGIRPPSRKGKKNHVKYNGSTESNT